MSFDFEVKTQIEYEGQVYPGIISGTCEAASFVYGADADGNRGELTHEYSISDIYEIMIDIDEDKFLFLDEKDCKNWDFIKQAIYDDVYNRYFA